MKAMVLAAGLGTRLRPLTDNRPKALVEIAGRTLLEITLTRLRSYGVREVIVNVHHHADQIPAYLHSHANFGLRIEISREDVLLDTGGGLKKAAWFFLDDRAAAEEPFFLHNVDVLSTIDLHRMLQFHREHSALATLAVQHRPSSRYLLFDPQLHLCGRRTESAQDTESSQDQESTQDHESTQHDEGNPDHDSDSDNESAMDRGRSTTGAHSSPQTDALAFSGIHVISPHFLRMMTEDGAFSIITSYLHLAAQGEKILAFPADEYYWRDLGKPADLKHANQDLKQKIVLE